MNCSACGTPLSEGAAFCAKCGKAVAAAVAAAAAPGGAPVPSTGEELPIFESRPVVLPSLGAWFLAFLTVGIALFFYWLRHLSVRYKVTTKRVLIETGILSKRTDNTELYRVRDAAIVRPFWQRLVGTANIVLVTTDTTHPQLTLYGLRGDVDAWFARVRDSAEAERIRRGRLVMEQ